MEQKKEQFGSKIGFILAAAGSAVGLGNIWRFPYLAARDGGGVFLLVYIVFALTFGFSLLVTEIAIGRKTGRTVITAYKTVKKPFAPLGILAALVPVIIVPYYCVIGGWVLKYLVSYATGHGSEAAMADGSYFTGFIGAVKEPTIFFIVFVLLTAVSVLLGVQKGIERVSKIMMPALLVIIIALAVYTLTLDGAMDGLKYYVLPDFSKVTPKMLLKTAVDAMGQLFYSTSLAMGIMVTYGSYMRKEDSIEKSARQIGIFDTLVAVIAGMIIVPAVFVFSGGDADAINAGPSLMFITMPSIFETIPGGHIIGAAFFVLVALAALTSSISLMETVASIISEKFNIGRKISSLITLVVILTIGMLSVLGYSIWDTVTVFGYQFLDFFDFISNNIMMPVVAFFTCILVSCFAKIKFIEDEVLIGEDKFKSKKLYLVMITAVAPVCMLLILFSPLIMKYIG